MEYGSAQNKPGISEYAPIKTLSKTNTVVEDIVQRRVCSFATPQRRLPRLPEPQGACAGNMPGMAEGLLYTFAYTLQAARSTWGLHSAPEVEPPALALRKLLSHAAVMSMPRKAWPATQSLALAVCLLAMAAGASAAACSATGALHTGWLAPASCTGSSQVYRPL